MATFLCILSPFSRSVQFQLRFQCAKYVDHNIVLLGALSPILHQFSGFTLNSDDLQQDEYFMLCLCKWRSFDRSKALWLMQPPSVVFLKDAKCQSN
jgi:hypothetical protein